MICMHHIFSTSNDFLFFLVAFKTCCTNEIWTKILLKSLQKFIEDQACNSEFRHDSVIRDFKIQTQHFLLLTLTNKYFHLYLLSWYYSMKVSIQEKTGAIKFSLNIYQRSLRIWQPRRHTLAKLWCIFKCCVIWSYDRFLLFPLCIMQQKKVLLTFALNI